MKRFTFIIDKELIFIDDCSTDDSSIVLNSFKFKSLYKIARNKKNSGKGASIRKAISMCSGDFIAIQDADFEYDFDDLNGLLGPILENKADVVYGSRFRRNGNQVHRTFHYLVNRFLTLLSNVFSGLYLSDMETCYKVFRADILKNIQLSSNRFGFEPEVTAKIAFLKIRIQELPISYYPRSYVEGKKIGWKDGVAAIWHIIYYNSLNTNRKSMFKEGMPKSLIIK